jgi:hypothetical protein
LEIQWDMHLEIHLEIYWKKVKNLLKEVFKKFKTSNTYLTDLWTNCRSLPI